MANRHIPLLHLQMTHRFNLYPLKLVNHVWLACAAGQSIPRLAIKGFCKVPYRLVVCVPIVAAMSLQSAKNFS